MRKSIFIVCLFSLLLIGSVFSASEQPQAEDLSNIDFVSFDEKVPWTASIMSFLGSLFVDTTPQAVVPPGTTTCDPCKTPGGSSCVNTDTNNKPVTVGGKLICNYDCSRTCEINGGGAGTSCTSADSRCSGSMRQFCVSGSWKDSSCPSGTSCVQTRPDFAECKTSTVSGCKSSEVKESQCLANPTLKGCSNRRIASNGDICCTACVAITTTCSGYPNKIGNWYYDTITKCIPYSTDGFLTIGTVCQNGEIGNGVVITADGCKIPKCQTLSQCNIGDKCIGYTPYGSGIYSYKTNTCSLSNIAGNVRLDSCCTINTGAKTTPCSISKDYGCKISECSSLSICGVTQCLSDELLCGGKCVKACTGSFLGTVYPDPSGKCPTGYEPKETTPYCNQDNSCYGKHICELVQVDECTASDGVKDSKCLSDKPVCYDKKCVKACDKVQGAQLFAVVAADLFSYDNVCPEGYTSEKLSKGNYIDAEPEDCWANYKCTKSTVAECKDKSDGTSCGTNKFCSKEKCISQCSGVSTLESFFPIGTEQCAFPVDIKRTVNKELTEKNCWVADECVMCEKDSDCSRYPNVVEAKCHTDVGRGYCELKKCTDGFRWVASDWWAGKGCIEGSCDLLSSQSGCNAKDGCHWVEDIGISAMKCRPLCSDTVKSAETQSFLAAIAITCEKGFVKAEAAYDLGNKCWREAGCVELVPEDNCKDYGADIKRKAECESDDRCYWIKSLGCKDLGGSIPIAESNIKKATDEDWESAACLTTKDCDKGDFDTVSCQKESYIEDKYGMDIPDQAWDMFRSVWGWLGFGTKPEGYCIGSIGYDWCSLPMGCTTLGGYDVPWLGILIGGLLILYLMFGKKDELGL